MLGMARQALGLWRLLQDISTRKLVSANWRSISSLSEVAVTKLCVYFYQPRRWSAQEKRARDAAHHQKVKWEKINAKKKIPILQVPNNVVVGRLAVIAKRTPEQIYYVKSLVEGTEFKERKTYPLNELLHGELLTKIVRKLGYRPMIMSEEKTVILTDRDIYAQPVTSDGTELKDRPPIVAIMGHIDHGKTTILDALRRTSVASSEAGGITQSIGAFSVSLGDEKIVTFLDTPGHSVFSSMRERGAKVTDIAVLVVAADDGVMEQTIESIKMVKMAESSMVVALNKCDKKDAAPDLIIQDLALHGVKCEEIGGNIPAVRISALKNIGLDKLVETIIAKACMLELKYDPDMQVQGVALESKTEKGKGNLVSVILKQGTLKAGKILVAGTSMAKVKLLLDADGKKLMSVLPGQAANVMGWKSLPEAGQVVLEAESEFQAKAAIKQRQKELKVLESDDIWNEVEEKRKVEREEFKEIIRKHPSRKFRLAESFRSARRKNKIEDTTFLKIIVKADVNGSLEAITKVLDSYDSSDQCRLKLVCCGVGELKSSEYVLAQELGATVFLFNTEVGAEAKKILNDSVTIVQHSVIYHLVNDLIEALNKVLPPIEETLIKGEAEVLQKFVRSKKQIAGCRVLSGMLDVNEMHSIVRDGTLVHQGSLQSMREHGTPITQAKGGDECGLTFSDDCDIKVGDKIQCYTTVVVDQKTKWQPPGF